MSMQVVCDGCLNAVPHGEVYIHYEFSTGDRVAKLWGDFHWTCLEKLESHPKTPIAYHEEVRMRAEIMFSPDQPK